MKGLRIGIGTLLVRMKTLCRKRVGRMATTLVLRAKTERPPCGCALAAGEVRMRYCQDLSSNIFATSLQSGSPKAAFSIASITTKDAANLPRKIVRSLLPPFHVPPGQMT